MALSRFQIRLLRWISAMKLRVVPHEGFGNLTVLCAISDQATRATLFKQAKLALGLLKLRAPVWFRRVQTEITTVSLIELGPGVGLARFDLNTRDCVVNATALLAHPEWAVADIALALVHEATHGWLFRRGVRPSTAEEVQRVELVCNRAEACLVARIPEVPLLGEIVARRRTRIPEGYSDLVRAKRSRAYYWALIRGALGLRPSRAVRPNER